LKVLGDYSPLTKKCADARLDKISEGKEKKEIKVNDKKNDILADPIIANLNTTIARRLVHNASIDIVHSARPCPPFPFKYVNFRNDSEVNRKYLLLVDKTFELKEKLKKKATSYVSCCFRCRDQTKEDTVECIQCHKIVCRTCMDNFTDDNIWTDTKTLFNRTVDALEFEEEEEEYEYLCNVCYKDDNENNNDKINVS